MTVFNEAPAELRALVAKQVDKLGLARTRLSTPAVACLEVCEHHNKWTPKGELRVFARCPAASCSGAEVVARGHDFLCGTCGTEASVDWTVVDGEVV